MSSTRSTAMWRVTLIQEYMEQHINVSHYPYAYAALFALEQGNVGFQPTKVVLERGEMSSHEVMYMSVEEFKDWCLQDDMV